MKQIICELTLTNWIEIIGIIASLAISIIAIIISCVTLKQNSKMIEESTRPYVIMSLKTTNFSSQHIYLVLKNYGTSGATITKLSCNHDLSKYTGIPTKKPFDNISGSFIAPNQSYITNLNSKYLYTDENLVFSFDIEYKNKNKTYSEHFDIHMESYAELVQNRTSTSNEELKTISYTLQDLVEKHL